MMPASSERVEQVHEVLRDMLEKPSVNDVRDQRRAENHAQNQRHNRDRVNQLSLKFQMHKEQRHQRRLDRRDQQREQKNPNQVHKMPVKSDIFRLRRKNLPAQRLRPKQPNRNNSSDHVQTMDTRGREITGIENILPRPIVNVSTDVAVVDLVAG